MPNLSSASKTPAASSVICVIRVKGADAVVVYDCFQSITEHSVRTFQSLVCVWLVFGKRLMKCVTSTMSNLQSAYICVLKAKQYACVTSGLLSLKLQRRPACDLMLSSKQTRRYLQRIKVSLTEKTVSFREECLCRPPRETKPLVLFGNDL